MLVVSNAIDANQMQTRNIKAIEDKIDWNVEAYVTQAQLESGKLLHEKIEAEAEGKRCQRELPLPPNARWCKKNGLQSTEEYELLINDNI